MKDSVSDRKGETNRTTTSTARQGRARRTDNDQDCEDRADTERHRRMDAILGVLSPEPLLPACPAEVAVVGRLDCHRCPQPLMEKPEPLCPQTSQSQQRNVTCQHQDHERQCAQTESQIREQFEELHRFLRAEEEARLAAMREEQERKRRSAEESLERMGQLTLALADTIKEIETELKEEDAIAFLQRYERTIKRTWKDLQSPERRYDSMIDVPKHVGNLRFRVWQKMKDICPFIPVIIDPNSASRSLSVSPTLDSLHGCLALERPLMPDNPNRFQPYTTTLGALGLTSGVHQWDVEVGKSTNWTLGVAYASVKRRAEFEACPEEGLWTISLREGSYLAMMSPCDIIHPPENCTLRAVRVCVDWEEGCVCFSDAESLVNLFSFSKQTFSEALYPYFETICKDVALIVKPQPVHVVVEELLAPTHSQVTDSSSSAEKQ